MGTYQSLKLHFKAHRQLWKGKTSRPRSLRPSSLPSSHHWTSFSGLRNIHYQSRTTLLLSWTWIQLYSDVQWRNLQSQLTQVKVWSQDRITNRLLDSITSLQSYKWGFCKAQQRTDWIICNFYHKIAYTIRSGRLLLVSRWFFCHPCFLFLHSLSVRMFESTCGTEWPESRCEKARSGKLNSREIYTSDEY